MRTSAIIALAVVGLVLAVGLTTAATELTSQRVGLQAEPLNAGDALAPRPVPAPSSARERPVRPQREAVDERPSEPATAPAPQPTAAPEAEPESSGDDDSGRGRGRGRGRSGDD